MLSDDLHAFMFTCSTIDFLKKKKKKKENAGLQILTAEPAVCWTQQLCTGTGIINLVPRLLKAVRSELDLEND